MPPKPIDLTGRQFGRWLVIEFAGNDTHNMRRWRCECRCGTIAIVRGDQLQGGHSQSCGCLQKELARRRHRTHGASDSPEYEAWANMHARCRNPSNPNYGSIGIEVCERWDKFENFAADMGPRPSPKHSIHRIDPHGNYEPGNCKWSDQQEQIQNTRRSKKVAPQARWLRNARNILGWTAREVGKRSGLSKGPILTFEAGGKLRPDTLHKIRQAFDRTSVAAPVMSPALSAALIDRFNAHRASAQAPQVRAAWRLLP
jgi:transcriptional regulator with XRE-family HTH domain